MRKFIFIFIQLSLALCAYSQEADSIKGCHCGDSLYEDSQYGNGNTSLHEFISNNVFPILSECRDSADISYKISYIYLEISEIGNVESVYLARFEYPEQCKNGIITTFLNMNDWIPARCNGKPIKSKRLIKLEY